MDFSVGKRMALATACVLGSAVALADDAVRQVQAHFDALSQSSGGAIAVEAIRPAAAENIYQVELSDGEVLHAAPSGNGEYLLVGSLMQLKAGQLVNITEQEREAALLAARAGLMDEVAKADVIEFAPEGAVKGTLNVFTDISCGFCRKLHQEVPALNAKGIAVRYLAFPRGGQRSPTYAAMQSIWCSDDRQQQMSAAKGGQQVTPQVCNSSAVIDQYQLGVRLGVNGTPAIFLDDGRLIPGYRDADTLAQMLGVD